MHETLFAAIKDKESAKAAAQQGVASAGIVASVTGVFAVLSIFGMQTIVGPLGLVDAAIFAVTAWRTHAMSRAWAVVGLLLYGINLGISLYNNGPSGLGLIASLLILGFIRGIQGTFAYHKYIAREASATVAMPPPQPLG